MNEIVEKTSEIGTAADEMAAMGFELAHIGINCENEQQALASAKKFEALFGFIAKEGNSSVFAGKYIEAMKAPYLGKNGHIAIATTDTVRAKAFLERQGFEFIEDSAKLNAKGGLQAIYLKDEIAGFAVHLVQK